MKIKDAAVVFSLCIFSMYLSACAVGWNHTSDAKLKQSFNQHKNEFQVLLAEVQADSQLTTLQRNVLIYAGQTVDLRVNSLSDVVNTGMSKVRWMRYQKQLRDLGLYGVMKGPGKVEFRVDSGSLSNGDSYKGYEYTTTPPSSVRPSLDGYRISDAEKAPYGGWQVYAPLQGDWFLYLFVNR